MGAVETSMTITIGLLLSLLSYLSIPSEYIAVSIFIISLIWIFFALRIKHHYLIALSRNINHRDIKLGETYFNQLKSRDLGQ